MGALTTAARRRHPVRVGAAALGAALLVLTVIISAGSVATRAAANRAERAVELNTAYQRAAAGVAAEESLERKYRLEPGPTPLAGHTAAEADVARALALIVTIGDAGDRRLVDEVLAQHRAYVAGAARLFASVDRHDPVAVTNGIDSDQVDPVFGSLQARIYGAAAAHLARARGAVDSVQSTSGEVLVLDIAALIATITMLALAAGIIRRSHRDLAAQSTLNRHQALHDALTSLPNRALFQDRAAQALRASKRAEDQVAAMVIDLVRFKDVNDTLGHQYGDVLLQQVAERFTSVVRGNESVARLGGDEFAVLLPRCNRATAVTVAERLTDVLHEPFTVKGISLEVEASIGIAFAGPDADVELVLRHADVAMYEAKDQHLPFAVYELTRDDNTVARLAMLGDLRRAISRGELLLHYQPKVAASGELHSVEALVRWQHPTRGLLAPAAFIPIAENTAVIHPLTAEVLRLALGQVRAWSDQGRVIPVAVNISARSLLDVAFPAHVQRILDQAGVPSGMLSLELTESAIMADPARALDVLRQLDAMGVSLSIDDFGTGYSSMAYLKSLPVRELKIDRGFVMGMATDRSDVVLVQSAVDLGHNLGLHVVAEGVEDSAAQEKLREMGCDLMQGYHIHRPVPAADLESWLARHETMPAAARPPGPTGHTTSRATAQN